MEAFLRRSRKLRIRIGKSSRFLQSRADLKKLTDERDFSNPYVDSINTSGHKFGLTPPAVGWVLWKTEECRARGMLSSSSYLSGVSESVRLSFSQPSSGILLQYLNFLRLGNEGYKNTAKSAILRAARFRCLLKTTNLFDDLQDVVLEPGSQSGEETRNVRRLPVIAFKIKDKVKHSRPAMDEEKLSQELREAGYSLPCKRHHSNRRKMEANIIFISLLFADDQWSFANSEGRGSTRANRQTFP